MKKETLTVETNSNGTIRYYNINGELHNPNGPALVWADGYKAYFINGERHNPDGPAVVWADGCKTYYINGQRLTEAEFTAWQAQQSAPLHNKTATIDGIEYTIKRNNIKKEKLKVYTEQGGTITYRNAVYDLLHNPDGPAMVFADGSKSYYINGRELTEAEFTAWQAKQPAPLHNKTATIDGIEYTLTAK